MIAPTLTPPIAEYTDAEFLVVVHSMTVDEQAELLRQMRAAIGPFH